ncbi:Hypothetical protein BSSP2_I1713 [Brucella suis bv. 2]|nr:Hypothetical protein BSSP3_I1711 [Brucella suis bv. 2]AIB25154.1 Hypothetical protein BSPT2_I1708 [Brucella suis bv. 2]AIB28547.1 Hypothetical protein BSSP1_I1708 [Brucella suis bv. 2]AIB31915.1 Hypothetical protein BSSP2_I1713 [Brucella suis bv. 2]
MHLPPLFVKKQKPQQGVAVIIFQKAGSFMPDITPRFRFGK